MSKVVCYNCGKDLSNEKITVEHIPAKNLYEGFGEAFKQNRITVPACNYCNNLYSKIDQEIRDALAVKGYDPSKNESFFVKGLKSILRRSNWKDRTHYENDGTLLALNFNYDDLEQLHIKNFKGLFYNKFGFPIPNNFIITIFADGDDIWIDSAQIIYNYILQGRSWEVSGHADIFKFILKDITLNEEGKIYESGDFEQLKAVVGLLVYHDDIGVIVMAGKKEYVNSCNPDILNLQTGK